MKIGTNIPVIVVCPSCQKPIEVKSSPITLCPSCGNTLPENLLAVVEHSKRRRRPLLITLAMWFSGLAGVSWLSGVLLMLLLPAPRYSIGDQEVERGVFLLKAGVPLGLLGLLAVIQAYGFWKEQIWARHLAVTNQVIAFTAALSVSVLASIEQGSPLFLVWQLATTSPFIIFSVWYFYGKKNVVAYYEQVKEDRRDN